MFCTSYFYNFIVFRYEAVIPEEKEWGRIIDGRWTGVIGMVFQNVSISFYIAVGENVHIIRVFFSFFLSSSYYYYFEISIIHF